MRSFLLIVPEGGMLFEAAGIADIIMRANTYLCAQDRVPRYQVKLATTQSHAVIHGQSGLNLLADLKLAELDPRTVWDTVVIVGRSRDADETALVVDFLRLAAPRARRVVSICAGAMLLAEAGLLNGRRATSHWQLLDTMQTRFPDVRVERGPLFVQDGSVWTSGGVSSGFDLTLALIEADCGYSIARDVAQDMVMYLHRPGGQMQFSRYTPQAPVSEGPLGDLQRWIYAQLAEDLSVEALAARVAMSPRNFTRVFTREVGTSPARYVAEIRLNAARERLEQTRDSVARIARETGFATSINLRRCFERQLHLTPGEYRQRFTRRKLA
ncbi:helix-turn-helix domain-containing protein [Pantoea sp. Mb-10]|uniref:GlxA family transcriptional regulator n=1 Tax=unclassified Pantoea TaxID=2630326 RepID=UPI001E2FCE67|nr:MULTISPECIES: helix-turn-helix domain-containing protein [unclassified Pantoea]MCE0491346.1 helix-turn-helix domain-containing protein [Pantoea sp. Mb-10]MCE0502160.1 helix-turn-helix domain-containing protein [Pantoea sp. Pb-8]